MPFCCLFWLDFSFSRGTRYGDRRNKSNARIHTDLSKMRACRNRVDANRCVPMVLRMQGLPNSLEADRRRLLRLLFLCNSAMSSDTRRQDLLYIANDGYFAGSASMGSLRTFSASQPCRTRHNGVVSRPAQSRHWPAPQNAAARPVIAAIRAERSILWAQTSVCRT